MDGIRKSESLLAALNQHDLSLLTSNDATEVCNASLAILNDMWRWKEQNDRAFMQSLQASSTSRKSSAKRSLRSKSAYSRKRRVGSAKEIPQSLENDAFEISRSSQEEEGVGDDVSDPVQDENEMIQWEDEIEVTDRGFKVCLRWLIDFILLNHRVKGSSFISEDCIDDLTVMKESIQNDSKSIPAGPIIPTLTSGVLYHVACLIIFPPNEKTLIGSLIPTSTSDNQAQGYINVENGFIDVLSDCKLIDFRSSLQDSVKSMIADRNPFYEVY
jgi:hypothetical protein